MKRYILLFLCVLVFLSVPLKAYAFWGPAFRIVAGEAGAQALSSLAYRAGVNAGTADAQEKIRQRWNLDLYNSMGNGKLQGGAFAHRISQERAEEILRQLRQKPTPIPNKPGWGKIAISGLAFLTGADILYQGYEAYKNGQEAALMYAQGDQGIPPGVLIKGIDDFSFGRYTDNDVAVYFLGEATRGGILLSYNPRFVDVTYNEAARKATAVIHGISPSTGQVIEYTRTVDLPEGYVIPDHKIASVPVPGVHPVVKPIVVPTPVTVPMPETYPVQFPEIIEIAVPMPGYVPSPKEWQEMNPSVEPGVPIPPIPGTNPNPNPEPKPEPKPTPVPEPVPSPVPFPTPVPVPDPVLPTDPPGDGSPEPVKWSKKFKSLVTTRFPFSLPWDAYFLLSIIAAEPKSPKVAVDRDFHVGSFSLPFKFSYDFSNLDPYMAFFRGMILVGFGFALVFATSRFFGGAK